MTWEGLNPPYATIVADPPWDHSDGTNAKLIDGHWVQHGWGKFPYSVMGLAEIKALPVHELAAVNAHLYLWTTNRFLRASYEVAEAWGFRPIKPIIWCKTPNGHYFGCPFGGNSVECCLFARRGNLPMKAKAGRQWFHWPRRGHSVKPGAFLDLVEQVSPEPYVELFARQPRLGWDAWGYGYETSAVKRPVSAIPPAVRIRQMES
jgi:N6-adenosine-specific RNA methylase IME4